MAVVAPEDLVERPMGEASSAPMGAPDSLRRALSELEAAKGKLDGLLKG